MSNNMFGTLHFRKGAKESPAKLRSFSSIQGKPRTPACDGCRASRVKCQERPNKDKCERCHVTIRSCTYHSIRRRSQASETSLSLTSQFELPNGEATYNDDKPDQRSKYSPDANPQVPAPQMEQIDAMTNKVGIDALNIFLERDHDMPMVIAENTLAQTSIVDDPRTSLGSLGEDSGPFDPQLAATATTIMQAEDMRDSFELSSLYDEFQQDSLTSLSDSSGTPESIWASLTKEPETLYSTPRSQLSHSPSTQSLPFHESHADPRTFAGLPDLRELARYVKGVTTPRPTTPISTACPCLRDLTATLFSLRSCMKVLAVDVYLGLYKQVMLKWQRINECPLGCLALRCSALLMLMNVQELINLHLSAIAAVNSTESDPTTTIRVGSFILEDEMDWRITISTLLATRMEELHLFLTRMSSNARLAGFIDVCQEYNDQARLLGRAFSI